MNGYFDYNATAPLLPEARDAWLEAHSQHWYNASGLYREGASTRRRLDSARERLAELLGCEPERLVFTSGATESNNAIMHVLSERLPKSKRVLSSELEHPSVQEPLLAKFPGRVEYIRTLPDAVVDSGHFEELIETERYGLATVVAANNECGSLQPWQNLSALCRNRGVAFHTDASQWIGKLPSQELGKCDFVTGSGHKFGGPKGVGFLMVDDESMPFRFLTGGTQEDRKRAGTENYPSVEALVTALEVVSSNLLVIVQQQIRHREIFERNLLGRIPGCKIIGTSACSLWNTVMFLAPVCDGRKWVARLSKLGFQVSTGSSCKAGSEGSARVTLALQIPPCDRSPLSV